MTPLRLNLIIRENNVDLLEYEKAGNTLVKSIPIHKGDVQSALFDLSNFVNESNNLNLNINFVIPPDQIKVFRKIPKSENNMENSYLAAKKVLNEENDIDISKVYFDIIFSKGIIEIGVVDKQKLLEAISFIESTGFKVLDSISILNDQQKSFIFKSQKDFKKQSYFENWLKGKELPRSLKSGILNIKNLIISNSARNLAFLSFALLTSVVLSTTYFDRSVEEKRENVSTLKSNSAVTTVPNKKEREQTVSNPINIFLPSEGISLSLERDSSLNKLPSLPSKIITQDHSEMWIETILDQEISPNMLGISTVNINNPWIQLGTLQEQFLESKNLEKKLAPSIQEVYRTEDPPIISKDISSLFKNESKISVARLSLEAPVNKIRVHPKLRPNTYPFEIKEIPKQYARPRVRPAKIKELAAKSQIFSNTQIGLSVKPKDRPKIRKRIVVADYSGEGEEATVAGTISRAATKNSIVKIATTKNAINQRKLNLLSIYSRGSEKRAIILFPTGQTKLVKVGDTLDGGRVAAIGTSEIRYIKGGNNLVLIIPGG
ncbi:MAG: hypothetical protein P8H95_04865 [Paracoccaceae bacterium]|nr:hypothetical protein [Paracoccaceae bacterium]